MAPLSPVHWQTVTPYMRDLLRDLGRISLASRFYLAGGTALALRLGHRRSIDLDFFSEADPVERSTRREIVAALSDHAPQVIEAVDGNLLLRVRDQLHLAFLSYGYPLVGAAESVEGVAVASIVDVGLMKLDAVVSRGSRKDFVDLYFVARHISVDGLLDLARTKYPHARDFPLMAVESLVRFDNADRDAPPEMLADVSWEEVRRFFVDEARRLGEGWFRDADRA